MNRRKFIKHSGWTFVGLAATGSLLPGCNTNSKKEPEPRKALDSRKGLEILPPPRDLKMFWGDLHNHCNLTYGHGDMRSAFEAAREQLDFVSITPHAMWEDIPGRDDPRLQWVIDYHTKAFKKLRAGKWDEYVKMTNEYNKENEFLAFLSYECHDMAHGDHVALLYDLEAEMVEPTNAMGLKAALKGEKAFVTPHHMGYQTGYAATTGGHLKRASDPLRRNVPRHGLAESDDGLQLPRHGTKAVGRNRAARYGTGPQVRDHWLLRPARRVPEAMAAAA